LLICYAIVNMGSCSDLTARLDFSHGQAFEEEVDHRFGTLVHYPSPSPDGSFFLLATFRRFLFRLTEDSVSLALQSCLGGRAAGFHVQFLSTNHFRFSVSCKQVGFHVYRLRRVISSQFDVYFHLWNNGMPNWEREKRIWEKEQEKEWSTVLSKSTKRSIKKANNKRVSFAKTLVQMPPEKPAQPLSLIRFGSHLVPLPSKPEIGVISLPFVGRNFDFRLDRSRVLRDSSEMHVSSSDAICTADFLEAKVSNSNPSLGLTGCSRCLDTRHDRSQCANNIRCRACFNYGHVQRICLTKARPKLVWIRKEIPTNRIDCEDLESRAVDAGKSDSLPFQSRDQPNLAHPIPIVAKDHQMEDNGVQAGVADGIQASAADGAYAAADNWVAWDPAPAPKVVAQNAPEVPPENSSSSSDASAPLADEEAPKFMAANKLYAN